MSFTSHLDCPICGQSEKEIQFYGFSYCNHPVCGVCAIKLQKFSKDSKKSDCDYSKCVICKQDISKIIIASSIKQYEEFDERNLLCDNKYALLFESNSAHKFYNDLIQIDCPECKTLHENMEELNKHMEVHRKRYCELCMEFNKCLHFELDIYTDHGYHMHRTKTHPKCRFCDIRFYDESHLVTHVKDKHFVCDICHRNHGCTAYSTQSELLKHYAKDHFVCEICRVSNIINVFESEYILKTHKVSAHKNSLVGEGLVTVGFGDRDNLRYGARRRARDQDDGFFAEPTAIEIPQTIPTMNCEQEFPRLGDVPSVPVINQLGTQSLTLDENDTRTAFTRSDDDKIFKRPLPVPVPVPQQAPTLSNNKPEKMSDNFAISVKKSAGILNSEDFPSLSSNGGHLDRANRSGAAGTIDVSKAVKTSKFGTSSPSPRNTPPFVAPQNNEADFPALSPGSGKQSQQRQHVPKGATQNGSAWRGGATGKSGSGTPRTTTGTGTGTVTKVNDQHHQQHHTREKRDNSEEHETNQTPAEQHSKVSLMSQEEFQLTVGGKQAKQNNQYQHQSVPDEKDFPSLGRPPVVSSFSSSGTGTAGTSNWGVKSNLSDNSTLSMKKSLIINQDKFTLDSKSDFPVLPRSVGGGGKKKGGSKAGFASIASSPATQSGKPHVFSMVTPSNNKSVSTGAPAPPKMELACVFERTTASRQPASLRGYDYIPSVAPAKDPLVVVDSKQFSIMKQAKEHPVSSSSTSGGTQFTIGNDFPPMQSPSLSSLNNHFDVLSIDNHDEFDVSINNKTNNKKDNIKIAPRLASEADFPSLGAPKPKQKQKQQENSKKKTNRVIAPAEVTKSTELQPQPQPQPSSSAIVSLMDVAMSVAKKNYFSFPDNDERNQIMCESLYENLNTDLATQFLQLSNLYRTRKLSVQDYLASLHTDFVENLDFISRMLPQMCVLLPDIPLQRSLMSSMPKTWSKDLRECTKCDQVLLTSDVTFHNQLAH